MTIYEIKARTQNAESHFFDRATMRFFGQTLRMFSVRKMEDGKYMIYAPFGPGKPKGGTRRIFDPETNKLEYVKG